VGTSEFRTRARLFRATPRARHDELAPRSQARPASRQTVREPARRTPRTLRPESNAAYQVSFRRFLAANLPWSVTLRETGSARTWCAVLPPVGGLTVGGLLVDEAGDEFEVGAAAAGPAELPQLSCGAVVVVDRLIDGVGVELAGAVTVERVRDVCDELARGRPRGRRPRVRASADVPPWCPWWRTLRAASSGRRPSLRRGDVCMTGVEDWDTAGHGTVCAG
jgi:hypothetical protein